MPLKKFVVEDLFGEFTHAVDLDRSEGLTLIHGPNGVGKTTVLRLIDALFNSRMSVLARQPFSTIHATLTDGGRVQVSRKHSPQPNSRRQRFDLKFIVTRPSGRPQTWTYHAPGPAEVPSHMYDEYISEISRTGPDEWLNLPTGELLDLEEVLDLYGDQLPGNSRPSPDVPDWLRAVLASVPVFFIEAQRLQSPAPRSRSFRRLHSEPSPQILTVILHAKDLAERIKNTLASYGDFSQNLDSTFPARLLAFDAATQIIDQEALRARYTDQADRRNRYVRAGLLDTDTETKLLLPDRKLQAHEERVLSMLLDDTDKKLDQLLDLSAKVDLFLLVINGKFRRKSIAVDREQGFYVTTADGSPLAVSSLSSGEQQEIVLAYGLLFREEPGTLILVDEPELSLHISWQLDLIPDLLKIAKVTHLEFLIATHSPQVVGERWDLTVELSDGV